MKQPFKEYFGEENCKEIVAKLKKVFESNESVFIIIGEGKEDGKIKITDAYMNICPDCVVNFVDKATKDAYKKGLMALHGRFNLN